MAAAAEVKPKAIACELASGIDRSIYYAAFRPTAASELMGLEMGDIDGTVKPPFQPTAVAIAVLEGRRLLCQWAEAGGLAHLVYAGRGATVHVYWGTRGSAEVSTPAGTTAVLSMWGRPVPSKAASAAVGSAVVYAIVPDW